MKVGFGKSEVIFPPEIFPNPRERYTGVHDAPLVHTLLMEDRERYCFVFMDLVDPGDWGLIRSEIADRTGITGEHILLILSHPLTTPHCMHPEECKTPEELYADALLRSSIKSAVLTSVEKGSERMVEAKAGVGSTACLIHANRLTETAAGYDQALNMEGETDPTIPVIVFRDMEDRLLGVIYTVNTSPAVMENARLSDDSRLVSGDLASCSARILEERFQIHAVYTTGASADQWPILRALSSFEKNGVIITENHMENGYAYLTALSERLADQVGRAAQRIAAAPLTNPLRLNRITMQLPAHKRLPPSEVRTVSRTVSFEEEGTILLNSYVLRLGRTAIIGCQPEICVETAKALKQGSAYQNTVLMEFVNGTADYMASKDLYEKAAPQSKKGCFMPGAAELFVNRMLKELS